ncbi:glucose-1-phosphate thymidylyltransferase RfbA [Anaerovorax odorimutans]|uniref:Glucose-1-phosphate thymidylyltransferase n=1 Tax=Anaerovorax odorimutans TaxID=109327 RepID=A0ABT1RJY5_9FIRM|nr:glucose-1-phosphate thymidylyltransferase RfbA [Anaerovorax odorimutans]MCQ4635276.1 glucose-1-phosphate thymidylyltransferase RfbA [Anaerovorax odorimutans]
MKGIILAAGKGTRLYPMTKPVCKPLLPVYDKPLIYYPLEVLLQANVNEVLIIIPPGEETAFETLLGDGSELGISITYEIQSVARGIADALLIGEKFIDGDNFCLMLGDNIFYHPNLKNMIESAYDKSIGATVFGYWVEDPRPFGVVEFDQNGRAISIEEKPQEPKSNYIIPGLYFYDGQAVDIAKGLKPSARGELEITDVNLEYLKRQQLQVIPFEKDLLWFDAGNADSLFQAASAIRSLQKKGQYIGCIEEQAYKNGFISKEQMRRLGERISMSEYGKYLKRRS